MNTNIKWMAKNSNPPTPGWYYVTLVANRLQIAMRYWDGKVWWHATQKDGFTPNDSFNEWLYISSVTPFQVR